MPLAQGEHALSDEALPGIEMYEPAAQTVHGAHAEALVLILRLLTRKFGPIDELTQHHLENLNLVQLEKLIDVLLDFTTLGDLHAWLIANA